MLLDLMWIGAGLAFLVFGGEWLVRGAVAMAYRFRVTPAVVGLTIVAAGTSMPELLVSVVAAFRGNPDVAVGNVIGSNVFNIGFVLGTCALFISLPAEKKTLKLEWPFLLAATGAALLVMRNGLISRLEGAMLLSALIAFVWIMVVLARREVGDAGEEDNPAPPTGALNRLGVQLLFITGGLVLLFLGAEWVVRGAVSIAERVGVSNRVIGLTVVAMGTSLPELASSLAAAMRGRTDVAVGNIIGSSIFNLLGILGVGSLLTPMVVHEKFFTGDLWWLLGFTVLLVPVLYGGKQRVSRVDAVMLLGVFVVYMGFVLMG